MTVPHYGRREIGALTAASPGDTLYFPFAAFNDSGDSEAASGLAVTDIEIFKNGGRTSRATDSGYSLISDTGQVGDRVGLMMISAQMFNTSDDTGFFDEGSHYAAALDAITIDGKTVRFWLGQWETGRQKVDVCEIQGDTGAAHVVSGRLGVTDTGVPTVGQIRAGVDTGTLNSVTPGASAAAVRAAIDTGTLNSVHTVADVRTALDTGTLDSVSGVDVIRINGDTGSADVLAKATNGVGGVSFSAGINMNSSSDTGINDRLARITAKLDTGVPADVADTGAIANAVFAKGISVISDTGINARFDAVDTGKIADALLAKGSNLIQIAGDTGHATQVGKFGSILHSSGRLDSGSLGGDDTGLGGMLKADIEKVNDYTIAGSGDTGTSDTWRPA